LASATEIEQEAWLDYEHSVFAPQSFSCGIVYWIVRCGFVCYGFSARYSRDTFPVTSGYDCAYMRIEIEQEEDGRWLGEVPNLPGVIVYGSTREEAIAPVKALALRVLADRVERGEPVPDLSDLFSVTA
jgi:predicted RNase H-like HicB family nuclease